MRNKTKIVLSENFSIEMIKGIHEEWCHTGIRQIINRICPYYTAKNLIFNIKKYVRIVKYAKKINQEVK